MEDIADEAGSARGLMDQELAASHRIRLSQDDAHYGGDLVAGGRLMELFGDVATELCIRLDGDEGLLAGYSSVDFLRPVHAGDFVEARAKLVRRGASSRQMEFQIVRYAQPRPDVSESAADLLEEPELVARAMGTCVVMREKQRLQG
ncbi:MAG: 3-aminobutyryl-CoA ammonia-lyase [Actinomycetota bacterium]|jgi:3-aminobutyryl-CoA ammonia-lyase|nr:3-aminobutyryl-CoA ammonia-lyase [Actinomycetota bacterium]